MQRLAFFLLALALTLATAQAKRTFRVIYLEAPADAPKSMQLFDGRKSQEVKLPKMNLSPVYELGSGSKVLHLLDERPAKAEDVPAGSPSVAIDKGVSDFVLLVTRETRKDSENGGKGDGEDEGDAAADEGKGDDGKVLTLTVIEVDPRKVKRGGMLWCNLTDNHIVGTLGGTPLKLEPNAQMPVHVSAKAGESFPVNLSFKVPGDDKIRPLSETKWVHHSKGRIIQFVIQESGSIVPRLLGVADNR